MRCFGSIGGPGGVRRHLRWLPVPVVILSTTACSSGVTGVSSPTTRTSATSSPATTTTNPEGPNPSSTSVSPALVFATTQPPWPLPADARPYIRAAGLQALSEETLAVHYHAHLDIIVEGQPVTVPAGIGFVVVNGQTTALTSLHTHDTSGIIHIEAPANTPFTLGQVFTEWGVKLNSGQVGGLSSGGGNELRLYVDGVRKTTPPEDLVLRPHQEVVLWYGPIGEQPSIPSSYNFPSGD